MKTQELRELYLKFFEARGHKRLPSASLVPSGDATLLLTAAGMVPFKPYFLGIEEPEYKRVTTCQKCIRTPDIENVGKTARHGTFFEMLGNFSFGDYFKREAIEYAWEFVTGELKFKPEDVWITIYLDDDEAFDIWHNHIKVPAEKIVRKGKEDNFWEIGVGPCGPCSEIHIDRGSSYGCGRPECDLDCGCDRFMEIWNLVFIQYFKDENGEYTPLESKGIDTGMGLDRVAALLQGSTTIFDADETKKIRDSVCEMAKVKYGEDYQTDVAIRVITDHARSSTFMVSDGIFPTNEGRGYVLRRLLRRGMRFGRLLKIEDKLMTRMADVVIDTMKVPYPELQRDREKILRIISLEEDRFKTALEQGTSVLSGIMEELAQKGEKLISGADAFKLYDTFGFPYELTLDMAEEEGFEVDKAGFDAAMLEQRARARAARGDNSYMDERAAFYKKNLAGLKSDFVGYTDLSAKATIVGIIDEDRESTLYAGQEGEMIFDVTPFYGAGGGQICDVGSILGKGEALARVKSVSKPLGDILVHEVEVIKGEFSVGDMVELEVDKDRRLNIMRSHTATHLLHSALRRVLGEHVQQAGSSVEPNRLRFDFTHFEAMKDRQKKDVEKLVNSWILSGLPVEVKNVTLEEAKAQGATALFDEKYKEKVRMVDIEDASLELCGGTHLDNVAKIGLFKIISEGGISSGVRRIEAVVGMAAHDLINDEEDLLVKVEELLKVDNSALVDKVSKMQSDIKEMQKEITRLKSEMNSGGIDDLINSAKVIDDLKIVVGKVEEMDNDALRDLGDKIKDKIASGAVILGTCVGDKLSFLVALTKDAVGKGLHAGNIAKEMAQLTGGGGGGRPDMALAGGKDVTKLEDALNLGFNIVNDKLSN